MKNLKLIFINLITVISLFGLSGCSAGGEVEVTYMVDDAVYETIVFDSISSISHPSSPQKDGWEFVGWYTTDTFTAGTLFDKLTFEGEVKFNLYARFTQDSATIYIDGVDSGKIVLNEASDYAPTKEDLSFDGWYIDANFTTKFDNQDVDNLYGRFRALVTITNGYEEVYTEFVTPGDSISEPAYVDVRKNYMSEDGYYHFTSGDLGSVESLKKFNFNSEITINTTINLMWESIGLDYSLSESNTLSVKRSTSVSGDVNASEVLSVPSYAYYEGVLYEVELLNNFYYSTAKKLIINYNVKGLNTLSSALQSSTSNLNEVILPDSLEVIFSSFTDTTSFTEDSIKLPDGIEVIIDSFRLGYYSSNGYDFNIVVPNSIKYMAIVTTSYTFDNNSTHYIENINGEKAIFTDVVGKKTLVSYIPENTIDVVIPEGIYGINASAFSIMSSTLDTLNLPSTFESVNIYPAAADYSYMNATLFENVKSYSLLQNLAVYWDIKSISSVVINNQSLPEELDNCLLGQPTNGNYINYKNSYFDSEFKVLFIGESVEQVFVNVYVTNLTINKSVLVKLELQSGESISVNYLLNAITIDGSTLFELIDSGEYLLNDILSFGEEFFENDEVLVTSNVYLTLNYSVSPAGAELTLSSDGTYYIVTGFDLATAKLQDDGTYLVNIPASYDNIDVTEISDEAMANQTRIGKVVIPNTVTIIGARAFYNCTNLTELEIQGAYGLCETVNGIEQFNTIGKIEYIYESAFENTAIISPVLGLESMKYIAPYAFKTSTITHFTNINSTSTNKGGIKSGSGTSAVVRTDLVIGKYYFSFETSVAFIYCYQGQSMETYEFKAGTETERLTLDLQVVAVAGGYNTKSGVWHYLALGYSGQSVASFAMPFITSVEILEGSMYYLSDLTLNTGLVLLNVSKVHNNAFTDMAAKYSENIGLSIFPGRDGNDEVNYISLEEASAVATADYYTTYVDENNDFNGIFEQGWWSGIMADDVDYETKMSFMANLYNTNMIWVS
ncbi:MAG: InlB B-repeat-containing protein [bacterium]